MVEFAVTEISSGPKVPETYDSQDGPHDGDTSFRILANACPRLRNGDNIPYPHPHFAMPSPGHVQDLLAVIVIVILIFCVCVCVWGRLRDVHRGLVLLFVIGDGRHQGGSKTTIVRGSAVDGQAAFSGEGHLGADPNEGKQSERPRRKGKEE